jgi:hypothetical protein
MNLCLKGARGRMCRYADKTFDELKNNDHSFPSSREGGVGGRRTDHLGNGLLNIYSNQSRCPIWGGCGVIRPHRFVSRRMPPRNIYLSDCDENEPLLRVFPTTCIRAGGVNVHSGGSQSPLFVMLEPPKKSKHCPCNVVSPPPRTKQLATEIFPLPSTQKVTTFGIPLTQTKSQLLYS